MVEDAYLTQGGIGAYVDGYALAPRDAGGYWVWYLSLIGPAREGVRAAWAGLIASPPKPTTLTLPAHLPQHEHIHAPVWAAPRTESAGFQSTLVRLPRSAAYQCVLVPRIALLGHHSPQETLPLEPDGPPQPQPITPFVVLDVSAPMSPHLSLAEQFVARLDIAGDIPLLPEWAAWAWQTCKQNGWIVPLLCGGHLRGAYLCRIERAGFAAVLSQAVRAGLLPSLPEMAPPVSIPFRDEGRPAA